MLVARANGGVKSRVVGKREQSSFGQPFGGFLDLAARQAVHDAALALVRAANEVEQLGAAVAPILDHVADVGAIKARYEHPGSVEAQTLDDLGPRLRVGGGGKRNPGNLGKALRKFRKL